MTKHEAYGRGKFDGWLAAQPSYAGPVKYLPEYVRGYKQGEIDCMADMYEAMTESQHDQSV